VIERGNESRKEKRVEVIGKKSFFVRVGESGYSKERKAL